uniref:Putative secreted protein n=1 Tax=Anopheles triannulatus TaxID=58253 RepID=A0A2M4B0M2_9DIPT
MTLFWLIIAMAFWAIFAIRSEHTTFPSCVAANNHNQHTSLSALLLQVIPRKPMAGWWWMFPFRMRTLPKSGQTGCCLRFIETWSITLFRSLRCAHSVDSSFRSSLNRCPSFDVVCLFSPIVC